MDKFVTLDRERPNSAKLKVIGVGGGGGNAIDSMIKRGLTGVEYVAINTDAQVLEKNRANYKIQVGQSVTRGLGAGADPKVGRKAHEEDRDKITKVIEGSDMVFVTAGMGGGTGTGGAPLVASIAKSMGSLVIGIVTKPFRWEGKKRMMNAEEGIHELKQYVDSLIVIPNERLLNILDKSTSASTAFDKPNEVLYEATRGIADIITVPGIINVDFADVRAVMNDSGEALMGCGISSGENRAIEAAQKAISSPLLEGVSIKGAKNILLNVTGSDNLTMQEIDEGNKVIYDAAGDDANVIFGWVKKEEMNEYVSYTVIATGFGAEHISHEISSISKAEQAEHNRKKEPAYGSGFVMRKFDLDDTQNLEVPTILRVKGTNQTLLDNPSIPPSGYKSDTFSKFNQKEKENDTEKPKDEEDSSSFLRMMMD